MLSLGFSSVIGLKTHKGIQENQISPLNNMTDECEKKNSGMAFQGR